MDGSLLHQPLVAQPSPPTFMCRLKNYRKGRRLPSAIKEQAPRNTEVGLRGPCLKSRSMPEEVQFRGTEIGRRFFSVRATLRSYGTVKFHSRKRKKEGERCRMNWSVGWTEEEDDGSTFAPQASKLCHEFSRNSLPNAESARRAPSGSLGKSQPCSLHSFSLPLPFKAGAERARCQVAVAT